MQNPEKKPLTNPSASQIHQAVSLYLKHAYEGNPPESIADILPPEGEFDVSAWIMGEMVERDPAAAPLDIIRSAAFRFGNTYYPNMKFRISRPPNEQMFIFTVDSHDAVLAAKPGSADYAMLEELKAHNAKLADAIVSEWDKVSLPTERNFMRYKIEQAKQQKKADEESGKAKH